MSDTSPATLQYPAKKARITPSLIPLMLASALGSVGCVAALPFAGASTATKDKDSHNAFEWAAVFDNTAIQALLMCNKFLVPAALERNKLPLTDVRYAEAVAQMKTACEADRTVGARIAAAVLLRGDDVAFFRVLGWGGGILDRISKSTDYTLWHLLNDRAPSALDTWAHTIPSWVFERRPVCDAILRGDLQEIQDILDNRVGPTFWAKNGAFLGNCVVEHAKVRQNIVGFVLSRIDEAFAQPKKGDPFEWYHIGRIPTVYEYQQTILDEYQNLPWGSSFV